MLFILPVAWPGSVGFITISFLQVWSKNLYVWSHIYALVKRLAHCFSISIYIWLHSPILSESQSSYSWVKAKPQLGRFTSLSQYSPRFKGFCHCWNNYIFRINNYHCDVIYIVVTLCTRRDKLCCWGGKTETIFHVMTCRLFSERSAVKTGTKLWLTLSCSDFFFCQLFSILWSIVWQHIREVSI